MESVKEEKIIGILLFNGPTNIPTLLKETGLPSKTIYRAMNSLTLKGVIEKTGNQIRGNFYQIVPAMVPPEVSKNFRYRLGVLIDGVAELSESSDPANSSVIDIFVKSGIFTLEEMVNLKSLYEKKWEEMSFLKNEKSELSFSPADIVREEKSRKIANCQNDIVKMTINSGSEQIPNFEQAKTIDSQGSQDLIVKMTMNVIRQYSIIYNINKIKEYNKIYNILTDCTNCQNDNKDPDIGSFGKIFKKLFHGFLFDLPDEKKKALSSDPKRFGEMMLNLLFDEPTPFEEEETPQEKILPFKKPDGVKTRKKKSPPKKKTRPSKSKVQAEWEEKSASARMHPDFWKMSPVERDYEFAKTYVDVIRRMEGDSKASTWHLKLAVISLSKFMNPGRGAAKYVKEAHSARIKADMCGARYLDWILARFNAWDGGSKHKSSSLYPPIRNLASEIQSEAWEGYLKSIKGSVLLYTRVSLTGMELPFLLPENFHSDGHLEKAKAKAGDPSVDQKKIREYDMQCKLYEDFIFEDMKRIHDDTGGRLDVKDQLKKAIAKKIIPADWVYGFASHHNLPELKDAEHLIKITP